MQISSVNTESRKTLDLRAGDTVRVYQKIQEKDKTRTQYFEGLVLCRNHGTEPGATFTVRRSTGGFGVEKIFPLYSPTIEKIEIIKRSKTRRSKLFNIRRQALKQISKRMKMIFVDITSEDRATEATPEGEATDVSPEGGVTDVSPEGGVTDANKPAEAVEPDAEPAKEGAEKSPEKQF